MERLIIVFILVSQSNYVVFTLEDSVSENDNKTGNIGASTLFPVNKDMNAGENILRSYMFLSLLFGAGYHLNLVENIFSPGIYGDIHINLPALLTLFPQKEEETKDSINTKSEKDYAKFSAFQFGIRLYNRFKFNSFDIQPFAGVNFILEAGIDIFKTWGILIAFKNYGIEYSNHSLLYNYGKYIKNDVHRIAFVYRMW
jgi:hypothetical protein